MKIRAKIQHIQRLLDKEEYTDAATRCAITLDQILRYVVSQNLHRVDDDVRHKTEEGIKKRDKRRQGIEGLTMGQIVYVMQEAGFVEAWAQVSGKDLSGFQVIELKKLTQLQNEFMHGGRAATRPETQFLLPLRACYSGYLRS